MDAQENCYESRVIKKSKTFLTINSERLSRLFNNKFEQTGVAWRQIHRQHLGMPFWNAVKSEYFKVRIQYCDFLDKYRWFYFEQFMAVAVNYKSISV